MRGKPTDELARYLLVRTPERLPLTGATTPGGNSLATELRLLPLPIGTAGDVLTVAANGAGDLVPLWEAPPAAAPPVLTTKGDLLVYDTAETRKPVGGDGKVLMADASQADGVAWVTGVLDEDSAAPGPTDWWFGHRFYGSSLATPGVANLNAIGLLGAGTTQGTLSSADDTDGAWGSYSQSTVNLSAGKTAVASYQPDWGLTFLARIKTGADLTSSRLVVGMADGTLLTSDTPGVSGCWLRYSTAAGDDGNGHWRTVTGDGTNRTVKDSGATIAANTAYWLRMHFGTAKAKLYVDDVLVGVHEASAGEHVPASAATLNWYVAVTNLVGGGARTLRIGGMMLFAKR